MIQYREILNAYFFHIFLYIYFAILLVAPERSWNTVGVGLFMCTICYWLGHRFQHQLPTDGIWKYLNLHPAMHHHKKVKVSRSVELVLEFIYEVVVCLFFPIVIQLLAGDWVIPLSVIIYFSFFFALNHVVYYSILHSDVHAKHHKNLEINFIPDYFDHLFGKNADSHYEDMNQQIPLILMAALITINLKLIFRWKD